MTATDISADFPFESRYVEVHGSKMHYIEEGEGDPILFLHGNPTSSYLWRNVIPHLVAHGRCIAPDLIGMGKSDRPDISYRFRDQAKYLQGFIEALDLSNITLVIHDWGSALGFHYAMHNQHNIKAIAFMEGIVRPFNWVDFPRGQKLGFKLFRMPVVGWLLISVANLFHARVLQELTIRDLSDEELQHYLAPYNSIKSRKAIRQWPCEISIDGRPSDVHAVIESYNQKLQQSAIPKLLLHVTPGIAINEATRLWCEQNIPQLESVDMGEGLHFIQEDCPHHIGRALAAWCQKLK